MSSVAAGDDASGDLMAALRAPPPKGRKLRIHPRSSHLSYGMTD